MLLGGISLLQDIVVVVKSTFSLGTLLRHVGEF